MLKLILKTIGVISDLSDDNCLNASGMVSASCLGSLSCRYF